MKQYRYRIWSCTGDTIPVFGHHEISACVDKRLLCWVMSLAKRCALSGFDPLPNNLDPKPLTLRPEPPREAIPRSLEIFLGRFRAARYQTVG